MGVFKQTSNRFTIIELMMVIALLTVLISLINPVLKKAINQSENLTCKNNQKQIGYVMSTYTEDWNGRLPPVVHGWGANEWMTLLAQIEISPNISRREFNPMDTFFTCPTTDKSETSLPIYMQSGLGYNGNAGAITFPPRTDEYIDSTVFLASIDLPSETVLMGDDKTRNFEGPNYYHTYIMNARRSADHPRDRHSFSANYYWADGHVEEMGQQEFIDDGALKGDPDYFLLMEK